MMAFDFKSLLETFDFNSLVVMGDGRPNWGKRWFTNECLAEVSIFEFPNRPTSLNEQLLIGYATVSEVLFSSDQGDLAPRLVFLALSQLRDCHDMRKPLFENGYKLPIHVEKYAPQIKPFDWNKRINDFLKRRSNALEAIAVLRNAEPQAIKPMLFGLKHGDGSGPAYDALRIFAQTHKFGVGDVEKSREFHQWIRLVVRQMRQDPNRLVHLFAVLSVFLLRLIAKQPEHIISVINSDRWPTFARRFTKIAMDLPKFPLTKDNFAFGLQCWLQDWSSTVALAFWCKELEIGNSNNLNSRMINVLINSRIGYGGMAPVKAILDAQRFFKTTAFHLASHLFISEAGGKELYNLLTAIVCYDRYGEERIEFSKVIEKHLKIQMPPEIGDQIVILFPICRLLDKKFCAHLNVEKNEAMFIQFVAATEQNNSSAGLEFNKHTTNYFLWEKLKEKCEEAGKQMRQDLTV